MPRILVNKNIYTQFVIGKNETLASKSISIGHRGSACEWFLEYCKFTADSPAAFHFGGSSSQAPGFHSQGSPLKFPFVSTDYFFLLTNRPSCSCSLLPTLPHTALAGWQREQRITAGIGFLWHLNNLGWVHS